MTPTCKKHFSECTTCSLSVSAVSQEMNAKYEAGKAEANATLEVQRLAAADAQAAITQAAEAKLNKLQLQVRLTLTVAQLLLSCQQSKRQICTKTYAAQCYRLQCMLALSCQNAGSPLHCYEPTSRTTCSS